MPIDTSVDNIWVRAYALHALMLGIGWFMGNSIVSSTGVRQGWSAHGTRGVVASYSSGFQNSTIKLFTEVNLVDIHLSVAFSMACTWI